MPQIKTGYSFRIEQNTTIESKDFKKVYQNELKDISVSNKTIYLFSINCILLNRQ